MPCHDGLAVDAGTCRQHRAAVCVQPINPSPETVAAIYGRLRVYGVVKTVAIPVVRVDPFVDIRGIVQPRLKVAATTKHNLQVHAVIGVGIWKDVLPSDNPLVAISWSPPDAALPLYCDDVARTRRYLARRVARTHPDSAVVEPPDRRIRSVVRPERKRPFPEVEPIAAKARRRSAHMRVAEIDGIGRHSEGMPRVIGHIPKPVATRDLLLRHHRGKPHKPAHQRPRRRVRLVRLDSRDDGKRQEKDQQFPRQTL